MSYNLKIADKNVNKMKYCCFFSCMKFPKKKNTKNEIDKKDIIELDINNELSLRNKNNNINNRIVKNITGDKREDEIDSNLKEASLIIKDIKNQAILIGDEIDEQNILIENINNNIINNDDEIKKN